MAFFFIRMQVILASNSPRRKELFSKICPSFITAPANVNEDVEEGVSPLQTVKILARRKAEHAFQTALNAGMGGGKPLIVLGSDTVVAYNGAILGKPKDEEEAAAMLTVLFGQYAHRLYGGMLCHANGRLVRGGRIRGAISCPDG